MFNVPHEIGECKNLEREYKEEYCNKEKHINKPLIQKIENVEKCIIGRLIYMENCKKFHKRVEPKKDITHIDYVKNAINRLQTYLEILNDQDVTNKINKRIKKYEERVNKLRPVSPVSPVSPLSPVSPVSPGTRIPIPNKLKINTSYETLFPLPTPSSTPVKIQKSSRITPISGGKPNKNEIENLIKYILLLHKNKLVCDILELKDNSIHFTCKPYSKNKLQRIIDKNYDIFRIGLIAYKLINNQDFINISEKNVKKLKKQFLNKKNIFKNKLKTKEEKLIYELLNYDDKYKNVNLSKLVK